MLDGISQRIDHSLPTSAIGRRIRIGTPIRTGSSSNLGQPGSSEVVILKGAVPHRSPDPTTPTAIEKRLSLILYLGNAVVDLVRPNLVSAPHTDRPSQRLALHKADLDWKQVKSIDRAATGLHRIIDDTGQDLIPTADP